MRGGRERDEPRRGKREGAETGKKRGKRAKRTKG